MQIIGWTTEAFWDSSSRSSDPAGPGVERALEILGDDIPDHLREAGDLRPAFSRGVCLVGWLERLDAIADL